MPPNETKVEVKFSKFHGELMEKLREDFPHSAEDFVQGDPGGFVLTSSYAEHAEEFYNLQIRQDDVWIVTFPKCGTTWTQELIWLIANDCDFQKAKDISLGVRFPFLESPYFSTKELVIQFAREAGIQNPEEEVTEYFRPAVEITTAPSPRFIKTHLPFYLLPESLLDTAKVVYVARNPKDVIVSYYHHHKLVKFQNFRRGIREFAEYFIEGQVMYSPFFQHVLEAWNKRHHPNLLFLFYEDMKMDLTSQVMKLANFLNKPVSQGNLPKLLEHLSIKNFAHNTSVNFSGGMRLGFIKPDGSFIRKGSTHF